MLDNKRRFARYPFAASVLFPDIERVFACTLCDISLGGAYLAIGNEEILGGMKIGQNQHLLIQGIGEIDTRVARKDSKGVAFDFWLGETLPDGVKDRLVHALTRELRALYEDWAADWQGKLRPAPVVKQ